MKITINKQSSIRINNIFFDPYEIEEQEKVDYIFITHSHYDHFDIESIKKIIDDNTKIIIPEDKEIYDKLSNICKNIIKVKANTEYKIDDLIFSTTYSYNVNKPFHKKNDSFLGYKVNIEDNICYIMGDTDITEENKKEQCDILFIPIGGTYTMDYNEAAMLTNIIKPKLVIPIHYGSIVGDISLGEKFKNIIDNDIECDIKIK
ncbi:MAG: MBL fold metallo-hydrolase [Bacilli bacterium]|nr:MBL fold metallo-hydrolase [Bacilli bacterium]